MTAIDALRNLERDGADLWISRQVLREYLAALTRPHTLTDEIPISALTNDVRTFSAQLQIAEEGPAVTKRLLALMSNTSVGGKQVHDANIVATMHEHGITRLLTHNIGDFRRFADENRFVASCIDSSRQPVWWVDRRVWDPARTSHDLRLTWLQRNQDVNQTYQTQTSQKDLLRLCYPQRSSSSGPAAPYSASTPSAR